jgi:hypothetical protein
MIAAGVPCPFEHFKTTTRGKPENIAWVPLFSLRINRRRRAHFGFGRARVSKPGETFGASECRCPEFDVVSVAVRKWPTAS